MMLQPDQALITEITGDVLTNGDIRFDEYIHSNVKPTAKWSLVKNARSSLKGEINCAKNQSLKGKLTSEVAVKEDTWHSKPLQVLQVKSLHAACNWSRGKDDGDCSMTSESIISRMH